MSIPRASILMTVYNGEAVIEHALKSVLHQTLKPYEVVVVDDGSIDETAAILETYASSHPNLKVVSCEHMGRARALNAGLMHCRAPYVAINDCDDESFAGRLGAQVEYLDQHPEAVLIAGWARIIDGDGRILGERRIPVDDSALRRRLALGNPFVHSTVMYRKNALARIGGFNELQAAGVDYEAIERLARVGGLACLPMVVGAHRISDRQYFRSKMSRPVRWRAAAAVAVRAALRHSRWLLPVSLFVYGATLVPRGEVFLERVYGLYSRVVRGGPA